MCTHSLWSQGINPVLGRDMAQQKQRQFLDKKSKKLEEKKKNSPARQFPPYKVISKEEYFIRTSATHNHQTTNQNKTSKQLIVGDRHEVTKTTEKNEEEQILEVSNQTMP